MVVMDVGWQPDPQAPNRERWWDGVGWTEFTRVPFAFARSDPAAQTRVLHVRDSIAAAWWIANAPLIVWLATQIFFMFSLASALAGMLLSWLPLVAIVALFMLAVNDRDELRRRGCAEAASPFWMLGGPLVYLTARWLAVRPYNGRGAATLVVHVIELAVVVATLLF